MHIEYEYKRWLIGLACEICSDFGEYNALFEYLYSRDFYSNVGRDCNRADDGIALRTRFAQETGYCSVHDIHASLNGPCSVLEMMLALAIRCEEQIVSDPIAGDRTGLWLYSMLESLRLDGETDGYFNITEARTSIDEFLAHKYRRDGKGGLFTVRNRKGDMRRTEIWYQMCWFLDEYMGY